MFKKISLLFLMAAIVLSACGTMEVTIEQTPTPAIPTIDPTKIALEIEATSMSAFVTQQAAPSALQPLFSETPLASASPQPVSTKPSTPFVSTPPSSNSADLIVEYLYLEMEGRHGGCVTGYTPYGIRVGVKNVGEVESAAFAVDLNGSQQRVEGGLVPGQSIELHFAGTVDSGQYQAYVDAANEVAESNEDNNTLSFQAPTPTPPPLCTPTPTPVPQLPAAGICEGTEGKIVVVTIYPDIPDPRCAVIRPDQVLKVINRTQGPLQVILATFQADLAPGEEYTFSVPFGEYLVPGVYPVQVLPCCGPELWLKP